MNAFAQQAVDETVRRILRVTQPLRIILFGSAARGEAGPYSDLDLLIVVPAGMSRRQTAQRIYRELIGVGCAVDIVVVTQDDVERYRESPAMIIAPALQDGKVLYAA